MRSEDHAGAPSREPDLPAGTGTILVVDDDPVVLAFVRRALRSHGFNVATAGGGRDALRTVFGSSSGPAVLLSDIEMPGMSGIELAARVVAARPGIGVVLMSGDETLVERARGHLELVGAVIRKPFTLNELFAAVEAVLPRPERI